MSEYITIFSKSKCLLTNPLLNKGSAFTNEEREEFDLQGYLPSRIETIEQQADRAWSQLNSCNTQLQKNVYLMGLFNTNQTLFYFLVKKHLAELLPIIYTPTIGEAVKNFSNEWREPFYRGLYITTENIDHLEKLLENYSENETLILVVTDGEGVLGIGDQGVGSIYISFGKLILYSLFAGIDPAKTLPVVLDVGTNNQALLDNPFYLGLKKKRISGNEYDAFIKTFIDGIKKKFPDSFLHWEDFGRDNAFKNLCKYQNEICSFNDDIQGTGVVTLAAIMAAVTANKSTLAEQRIVIFGAGTAGTGIATQITDVMRRFGLSDEKARKCFWLFDKQGLLNTSSPEITTAQRPYLRDLSEVNNWQLFDNKRISLLDVIKNVHPTILIGCSGVTGAFTKEVVQTMASYIERPIILSLSNPTEKAEATPQDLLTWTNGKALIATGSPFSPVIYQGEKIDITQCNNALAFPGIGLGLVAVKATKLSGEMLWKAAEVLFSKAPILTDFSAPLLPPVIEASDIAKKIAIAVAKQAIQENVAQITGDVEKLIADLYWEPKYLPYKLKRHCEKR